jgi:DNA helicase-2/ATP-dependent DNA helicase PcrA
MTVDDLLDGLRALPHGPITPNEEQCQVMVHNDGPLWVIAGPGTGKTLALIVRCLRLMCVDGVAPESIVLTTFTRKAANQLDQRLRVMLRRLAAFFPEVGEIDISRLRLGTIHSICWDLLTESPGSACRHMRLLDETERLFLVYTHSRICKEDKADPGLLKLLAWADNPDAPRRMDVLPSRWQRARTFIDLLQRVVEDRVDGARLIAAQPHLALLTAAIADYERILGDHHVTDYTLVQQQALDFLSSAAGHDLLHGNADRAGIRHVIVDEYQDTNPLQAALYRALAAVPPHHLCVVGDDDQALYRFRGGTVASMVRFADDCTRAWPGCSVSPVSLSQTYRSHPAIVNLCNTAITSSLAMQRPGARVAGKAALRPTRLAHPDGPVVWAIRGKNANEVAANFAGLMRCLVAQGVLSSVSQCALLARSVKETTLALGPYIAALRASAIPVASSRSPKDHVVYQSAIGVLSKVLDPNARLLMAITADHESGLGTYIRTSRDVCDHQGLTEFAGEMHSWLVSSQDACRDQTLSHILEYILNTSVCMQAIDRDESAVAVAHMLRQKVAAYGRIVEEGRRGLPRPRDVDGVYDGWVKRVYRLLLRELSEARASDRDDAAPLLSVDAMPVLTIHRAKGLEFPAVAVVVGERGNHPDRTYRLERAVLLYRRDVNLPCDPITYLGGDDDERAIQDNERLAYVAYSRARDLLFLLVPDSRWDTPPAAGLCGARATFDQYVREWPQPQGRRRHSSLSEGKMHGLFE